MKRFALIICILIGAFTIKAETLSSVETKGSWIYLYNSQGKKFKSLSQSSVGTIAGYSSTFFVSRKGSWYYIYDSDGRRVKSMSASSVGDVIGVAGDTFTSNKGGWIYTWSKDGRKISSRYTGK